MTTNPQHISALREQLTKLSLDGFIVPLTDEHMSEYVGDYAQRLEWLTGFGGSAGNAAILMDKAAIFVDGRYTLQVKTEVDGTLFERHHFEEYPMLKWLQDNAAQGAKIGYDPELATISWVDNAQKTFAKKGHTLVAVPKNPIDAAWLGRPEPSLAAIYPHPLNYAGKAAEEKRAIIAKDLQECGADAAVITMLDSIAWAFNIRSKDVLNNPVPHAFAILEANESATLYTDARKVDNTLRLHLGNHVRIEPREAFYKDLAALGQARKTILVDKSTNNAKVFETLRSAGALLIEGQDPCILPKAIKNAVEQDGTRNAHIRDGAAVSEFLCWLSKAAPTGSVDELSAADKLWEYRQKRELIKDRSFETISGAGPNGAIVHYRVNAATNRKLEMNSIYLVDSGAQYLDGTTDITRTVAVGTPSAEMRDRFTRVLKGHIAIATTRFPKGTAGMALDSLARRPLWDIGLDYDHGTGHGVGSFLAVHEGPQRIAKLGSPVALEAGMILSNEPGYYKSGEYGIRIENLVLVKASAKTEERTMLEFETLTFVPIDQNLIDVSMLDDRERTWVNAYHADVYEKLVDIVDENTKGWLRHATSPL
ncbi:aminopeptidase P family protein [Kordiimonas pumila]|uniref:M24 family metallopeptidase n=1 Tax=Kordiimonas pumila TaxID=2161677 RepID=A0ABV7D054_9PROT|nr:aminopeptidase P family protein [Kordiimonas pumila]